MLTFIQARKEIMKQFAEKIDKLGVLLKEFEESASKIDDYTLKRYPFSIERFKKKIKEEKEKQYGKEADRKLQATVDHLLQKHDSGSLSWKDDLLIPFRKHLEELLENPSTKQLAISAMNYACFGTFKPQHNVERVNRTLGEKVMALVDRSAIYIHQCTICHKKATIEVRDNFFGELPVVCSECNHKTVYSTYRGLISSDNFCDCDYCTEHKILIRQNFIKLERQLTSLCDQMAQAATEISIVTPGQEGRRIWEEHAYYNCKQHLPNNEFLPLLKEELLNRGIEGRPDEIIPPEVLLDAVNTLPIFDNVLVECRLPLLSRYKIVFPDRSDESGTFSFSRNAIENITRCSINYLGKDGEAHEYLACSSTLEPVPLDYLAKLPAEHFTFLFEPYSYRLPLKEALTSGFMVSELRKYRLGDSLRQLFNYKGSRLLDKILDPAAIPKVSEIKIQLPVRLANDLQSIAEAEKMTTQELLARAAEVLVEEWLQENRE